MVPDRWPSHEILETAPSEAIGGKMPKIIVPPYTRKTIILIAIERKLRSRNAATIKKEINPKMTMLAPM